MNNRNVKPEKRLLLLVDPQFDFIAGSLQVPEAATKMNDLAKWLRKNSSRYAHKVITRDWHDMNHCSFAQNGGKWPRHCVANSPGAEIWPNLQSALNEIAGKTHILNKARDTEEYSIFDNVQNRLYIEKLVQDAKIDKIEICGIAGDICVLETLKQAMEIFGPSRIEVLQNFSPSLDDGKALEKFILENLPCDR